MTGPADCNFLAPGEWEAALEDRLSAERAAQWERHAGGCAACALLLADMRAFHDAGHGELSIEEREAFAARAPLLEAQLRRAARPTGRSWWRYGAAAAALVVVAFGLYALRGPRPLTEISLPAGGVVAVERFPASAPPNVRGGGSDETTWNKALEDYDAERFAAAAARFAQLAQHDPSSADAAFFAGLAALYGRDFTAGEQQFAAADERARQAGLPRGAINWYRALAAVARHDLTTARTALTVAMQEDGRYADKARALSASLPP